MGGIEIVLDNRSGCEIDDEMFRRLAAAVLESIGCSYGELGIAFVTVEEIEELNREHLGRDGATDVISFPLDEAAGEGDPAGPPLLLGDVIICPEAARRNASGYGVSLHEELCRLVIHGILHVRGFDHEGDSGQMTAREEELLADLCRGRRER